MEFRKYFFLVAISGIFVLSAAFYSYNNILYPVKKNISDVVDEWKKIKINEETLAKDSSEMKVQASANPSTTYALHIKIAILTKENDKLKESLEKAVLSLSEKENSSDKIAIFGILIAFFAMLPSWIELFLKFKRIS